MSGETRAAIVAMAKEGKTQAEMARTLGISTAAVNIHVSRAISAGQLASRPAGGLRGRLSVWGKRVAETKRRVAELLASGRTPEEIGQELRLPDAAVRFYAVPYVPVSGRPKFGREQRELAVAMIAADIPPAEVARYFGVLQSDVHRAWTWWPTRLT